jgi:flagellar hook assembly protein FlgD
MGLVPGSASAAPPSSFVTLEAPSPQSFSPDGDGNDDTTALMYCLDVAASASVVVQDSSHSTVKHVATSPTGPARCDDALRWDGTGDDAKPVVDGEYTIIVSAVSTDGTTDKSSQPVTVDRRSPGQITSPTSGAALTDPATLRFVASPGFSINAVSFSLLSAAGDPTCSVDAVDQSGTWSGSLVLTTCGTGPRSVQAYVQWTDSYGQSRYWQSVIPDVTLPDAAPHIELASPEQSFSPNDDLVDDVLYLQYCPVATTAGSVHVLGVVEDSQGTVIKSLVDESVAAQQYCLPWYGFAQSVQWDGTTDSGTPAPDGQYTIRLSISDGTGSGAGPATLRTEIDRRAPGRISEPAQGARLTPGAALAAVPASGLAFDAVAFSLGYESLDPACEPFAGSSQQDGSWSAAFSPAGCASGPRTLTADISWTDRFGYQHSWMTPGLAVSIPFTAPVIELSGSDRTFSPNGDGQEDTFDEFLCILDELDAGPITVQARVVDGTHQVVRSLPDQAVKPAARCSDGEPALVSWDGADDAGMSLPDGAYTIEITAADATAATSSVSLRADIDTRIPGELVDPVEGTSLAGIADVTFTTTPGFPSPAIDISISDSRSNVCASGTATADPATADRWSLALDTSTCSDPTSYLTAQVSWTDDLGATHFYSVVRSVRFAGAAISAITPSYSLTIDAAGSSATTTMGYCVYASPGHADVSVEISDDGGHVVRTLATDGVTIGPFASNGCGYTSWDGMDDVGAAVPDGNYVAVFHTTAGAFSSSSAPQAVVLDRTPPGVFVAPSTGSTLSDLTEVSFAASPGIPISSLWFEIAGPSGSCASGPAEKSLSDPTLWSASFDTSRCLPGRLTVSASVNWFDALGSDRTARVDQVVVRTGIRLVGHYEVWNESGPSGIQLNAYRCLYSSSGRATTAAEVSDASGAVVRTLPPTDVAYDPTQAVGNCFWVLWDGKDQSGANAPDGDYTLRVTAADGASFADNVHSIRLVRSGAGALTSPAAGEHLSRQVQMTFRTSSVNASTWSMQFNARGWRGTCAVGFGSPDINDPTLWTAQLNVADCGVGEVVLSTYVSWSDEFGASHYSSVDTRTFLDGFDVSGNVQVRSEYGDDGTPRSSSTSIYVCVHGGTGRARATAVISSADGSVVATLAGPVYFDPNTATSGCASLSPGWDGRLAGGAPAPDGVYSVTLTATERGASASTTLGLELSSHAPGSFAQPPAGTLIQAAIPVEFVASAAPAQASVYLRVDGYCGLAASRSGDTYRASLDPTTCYGLASYRVSRPLSAHVYWPDSAGAQHEDVVTRVLYADVAPRVDVNVAPSVFSPNGDGQEDSLRVGLCVVDAADAGTITVSTRILNGAGTVVRSLPSLDVTPSSYCGSYLYDTYPVVRWDGTSDDGSALTDGDYTVEQTATDGRGVASTATAPAGIDRRAVGTVTEPVAGSALSGIVQFGFTPMSGLNVSYVAFSLANRDGQPCTSTSATGPDLDGVWRRAFDVSGSGCGDGARTLLATVRWTDRLGQAHETNTVGVPVTLDNPAVPPSPQVEPRSRVFSPNGDGYEDFVWLTYRVIDDPFGGLERATIDIITPSGAHVRSLGTAAVPACSLGWYYSCSWQSTEWDGRDDQGLLVAAGAYRAVMSVTDPSGLTAAATSSTVLVDNRIPASWLSPDSGAAMTDTTQVAVLPTPGVNVVGVSYEMHGVSYAWSCSASGSLDPNSAAWATTFDLTTCGVGGAALTATVTWLDDVGLGHYYSLPQTVTVHVPSGGPTVTLVGRVRDFSPNGDGVDETGWASLCTQGSPENGLVHEVVRVVDVHGAVVRTLVDHLVDPVGYCSGYYYGRSVEWDGKDSQGVAAADGVYTLEATSTDQNGVSDATSLEVTVDRRVPGALTEPVAGSTLLGAATLKVEADPGVVLDWVTVDVSAVGSSAAIGLRDSTASGTWTATLPTGSFTAGPATLRARIQWTDPYGQQHQYSRYISVVLDTTNVPLNVSTSAVYATAPYDATVWMGTSDGRGASMTLAVDWGDGSAAEVLTVESPYPQAQVHHIFPVAGSYLVTIKADNGRGNSTSRSVGFLVRGPTNGPPTVAVSTSPTSGVAPLLTTTTVSGVDPEGDRLSYSIDFGDGSAAMSGAVPTSAVDHTFTSSGVFNIRTTITDGVNPVVRYSRVTVGQPVPLAAAAGDDQSSVAGATVHFDGTGSAPSEAITSYHWDFGDGTGADGPVADHVYSGTGSYTAQLTIRSGATFAQDTAAIRVAAPVASGKELAVTVIDVDGAPIPGALAVVIDSAGVRTSGTADAQGAAHLLGLLDGSYNVNAVASGFQPAAGPATIADGAGAATIVLKRGAIATASLTAARMTLDQIVAAGIDPNAPGNQNVTQFTINLAIDSSPAFSFSGFSNGSAFPRCPAIAGVVVDCGGGRTRWSYGGNTYSARAQGDNVVFLVIPAKARWLKEFFDVTMLVTNLSSAGFSLTHGTATLDVPSGMSLAPTSVAQSRTVTLPDIPGGGSASAHWILRGDDEGFYPLSAQYSGILDPLGSPVTIAAQAEAPIHVWGASALALTVDTDAAAYKATPYHVTVTLSNVSDAPVYNLRLELAPTPTGEYLLQPRQQGDVSVGRLDPGASIVLPVVLLPTISGPLDLSASFVGQVAGLSIANAHVLDHPPVVTPTTAQRFEVHRYPGGLGFTWDSTGVDAADVKIFSTPNDSTSYSDTPLPVRMVTSNSAFWATSSIPDVALYALSLNGSGDADMRAALTTAGLGGLSPIISGQIVGCTATSVDVTVTDPVFALTALSVPSPGGMDGLQGVGSQSVTFTIPIDRGNLPANGDYAVTATNAAGEAITERVSVPTRCTLFAMGDSFSAGEGASRKGVKYQTGTEERDYNMCHRARGAYGVLLSQQPPFAGNPFGFNACSGAVTQDFLGEQGHAPHPAYEEADPQWPGPEVYGDKSEIQDLKQFAGDYGDPSVITLTLGGNDAGFSHIILKCLFAADCSTEPTSGTILDQVKAIYEPELKTFSQIRSTSPRSEVYVLAYPSPTSGDTPDCGGLDFYLASPLISADPLGMTNAERVWIKNTLVPYINAVVGAAARAAGVHFVPETADALNGHEICSSEPYANGITAEGPFYFNGSGNLAAELPINKGSFHPTDLGQREMFNQFWSARKDTIGHDSNPSPDRGVTVPDPGGDPATWVAPTVNGAIISTGKTIFTQVQDLLQMSVPGYRPFSLVIATLHSTPVVLGTAIADEHGVASFDVVIPPATAPGGHQLVVTGVDPSGTSHIGTVDLIVRVAADDADGDGVVDLSDNCPFTPNPDQAATYDPSTGDACNIQYAADHPAAAEDLPAFTSGTPGIATLGQTFGFQFTTSGSAATFAIASGVLPTGLSLDAAGGLTGVPTESGTFVFTVRASNVAGSATSVPVELTVQDSPRLAGPAAVLNAIVGDDFGFGFGASGWPVPTYFVSSGGLPPGMSLRLDGYLSGAPTLAGTYTFSVSAVNAAGSANSGDVTMIVAERPAFEPGSPPEGVVGSDYAFHFGATGSPSPSFTVDSGLLPTGLSLDSAGQLTGSPDTAGAFTFTVAATNLAGSAVAGPFTVVVTEAPGFSSGAPSQATVGTAYGFDFTASGSPAPSFQLASGTLPDGLSVDPDGHLHGTPSVAGSFTFSVAATNSAGSATAGPFIILVTQAPAFTSSSPPSGLVGATFGYDFTATGSPAPSFSIDSGSLPDGLALTSAGHLAGTPTTAGSFTFSVQATNSAGSALAGPFTIVVSETPSVTSAAPPAATVGSAYAFDFTASGSPSPTFSVDLGTLPTGLTLSAAGHLSGNPTAGGSFTFSVMASNSVGSEVAGPFTVDVTEAPLFTSAAPGAGAKVGSVYAFDFTATGSPAPTFTVDSGSIPSGLTLTSGGHLAGAPTVAGSYTFSVMASNSAGSATAGPFTVVVAEEPVFTSAGPHEAGLGAAYQFDFTATGAPTPAFTVDAGTLPTGLGLSSSGRLSGAPTAVGSFTFTVKASNSAGSALAGPFTIVVSAAPVFTSGAPSAATVGSSYAFDFTASGSPAPTFTVVSGTLADGLALSSTGHLTGIPTTPGSSTFSVKASNSQGTATAGPFTLVVSSVPVFTSGAPTAGLVGAAYAFGFSTSGSPAPAFGLVSGALPGGLTLDTAGHLSGTPTVPGTFTFSVTATNIAGAATAGPFTVVVNAIPVFTSGAPTPATVGSAYTFDFAATGSPSPTFAVDSGSLPTGLTLTASGNLSGTPTAAATFTFSVRASNSVGSVAAGAFTLVVTGTASTGPTVDAAVSVDASSARSRFVSPTISVPAGDAVLVLVAADGSDRRTQSVISVSGGGLRWSRVARANAIPGTSEIWWARPSKSLSMAVTAQLANGAYTGSIRVVALRNVAGIGAKASARGERGAPSVTLRSVVANSQVWGVGQDTSWRSATLTTPLTQTFDHVLLNGDVRQATWITHLLAPTSAQGEVTLTVSGPTRDRWQFVGVELKAVAAAPAAAAVSTVLVATAASAVAPTQQSGSGAPVAVAAAVVFGGLGGGLLVRRGRHEGPRRRRRQTSRDGGRHAAD